MTVVKTRCAQGSPCWVSLLADDLAGAQEFYGKLLGWEFAAGPTRTGPYTRASLHGVPVAGIGMPARGLSFPVEWTPYFSADSADDLVQRIRACGGTVAVGPLPAARSGRLAIAADLSGAVFGVWEDHELGLEYGLTEGQAVWDGKPVPGAPVWNELVTSDTAGAAAFYSTVFGSPVEPGHSASCGGADLVLRVDGRAVAGIRGATALRGAPPRWRVHFAVADTDSAAALTAESGGQVLVEPYDTPYGRTARLCDPQGGRFSVVQMPESP
jgi:uncharacterized protein